MRKLLVILLTAGSLMSASLVCNMQSETLTKNLKQISFAQERNDTNIVKLYSVLSINNIEFLLSQCPLLSEDDKTLRELRLNLIKQSKN